MLRVVRIIWDGPTPPLPVMEGPPEEAPTPASRERGRLYDNCQLLVRRWSELREKARGKFVAVAGEQLFIADSCEAAVAWCERNHPDDTPVIQYVLPGADAAVCVEPSA